MEFFPMFMAWRRRLHRPPPPFLWPMLVAPPSSGMVLLLFKACHCLLSAKHTPSHSGNWRGKGNNWARACALQPVAFFRLTERWRLPAESGPALAGRRQVPGPGPAVPAATGKAETRERLASESLKFLADQKDNAKAAVGDKQEMYMNLKTGAESGLDYSTKW